MPKVYHVKSARKDNPKLGIKVGDEYWWWAHAYGPRKASKTPPKPSQLTQSSYLQTVLSMQEGFAEHNAELKAEDIDSTIDEYKERLEELKSECEENLENMPEHLRESSSSGEILQERIDNLDSAISELESIDVEMPEKEDDQSEEKHQEALQEWLEEKLGEIDNAISQLS